MDERDVLEDLGLSDGEVKVYLALLKLGPSPVSDIKKETKLHRTTIYDFVEKLINKGLVNYTVQKGMNYYKATDPEKLGEFLDEKKRLLEQVMPNLNKLAAFKKEEISVEMFKGKEGFKTLINMFVKMKPQDAMTMGIDEEKMDEHFKYDMQYYIKHAKRSGIRERCLVSEKRRMLYKDSHIVYRTIPAEFFTPTPTYIFKDVLALHVWEPMTFIIIKSKELANAYKKYFEMLWSMAKPVK